MHPDLVWPGCGPSPYADERPLRIPPGPTVETVIAVGMERNFLDRNFESCELVGRVTNRYGVANQAIEGHADLFVCRRLRRPWPDFWAHFQYYG